MEETLKLIDDFIYKFLLKHIDEMPLRFVKLIANYYTDARIRKIYWAKLGIDMGENTYPNLGLKLVANENAQCVIIGKNVSLAPNITFICHSSANNGQEINEIVDVKNRLTVCGNIEVEDEVWVGTNVTILPNVRIGRCSVIGAGSVVISNVEPYSVYAGVPAKLIRRLEK